MSSTTAVLVDGTPKVAKLTVDPDEHLVQVPGVSRPGSPSAEPLGELWSKLPAPASYALVGYDHPTLCQDQLDVSQGQTEHVIQPDGVDLMSVSCSEGVTRLVMCQ